ncbi:MAG: DUF6273 domain-containing protein [Firmicutes bacterium]|nr:DUF6273 domain-containing protein [Bacillota bacterium]
MDIVQFQAKVLEIQKQMQEASAKGDFAVVIRLSQELALLQRTMQQQAMQQALAGVKPAAAAPPANSVPPKAGLAKDDPVWPIAGNTGLRVTEPIVQDSGEQLTSGFKRVSDTHVEFGSYPQKADGGVTKIVWRILEEKDGTLLLLSEQLLDYRGWHYIKPEDRLPAPPSQKDFKQADIDASVTAWEHSQIRKWLNESFYNRAFNSAEKNRIIERLNTGNGAYLHRDYKAVKGKNVNINILTDDTYIAYEQRNCADTKDKVFLLNAAEAVTYFDKSFVYPKTVWTMNPTRVAKPTEFILKRGYIATNRMWYSTRLSTYNAKGYIGKEQVFLGEAYEGSMMYWLRNLGANDMALNNATLHGSQPSTITRLGGIDAGGNSSSEGGIRPAVLISL